VFHESKAFKLQICFGDSKQTDLPSYTHYC